MDLLVREEPMANIVLALLTVANAVRSEVVIGAAVDADAVVVANKTNEANVISIANQVLTKVALNRSRNAKAVVRTTGEASKTRSRASSNLLSLKRSLRERLKSLLLLKLLKSSKYIFVTFKLIPFLPVFS